MLGQRYQTHRSSMRLELHTETWKNGPHSADYIFICISLKETFYFLIPILLKSIPKGDKPLPIPMKTEFYNAI